MRIPFIPLFLTLVLAAGFAAAGEVLLRRRSRSLAAANEAMLVGMGVCGAVLFPLTVILHSRALAAEACLLAAALLYAAARRLRRLEKAPPAPRRRFDPVAGAILAGVVAVASGFAALNFRYTFLWDGFLIWATKAQLLSQAGALTREWFLGDVYDLRHLAYPPLVPLCEALLGFLSGGFAFDAVKPLFLLFYISMLAATYEGVRGELSPRAAATAALLVSLVPALSTGPAAGAYADMPQAAAVAAVVAAGLRGRRDSFPWLVGTLTTVKAEGLVLAGLAGFGVLIFWALESRGRVLRRLAGARTGVAIVAAFVVLRVAYVRWVDAPELIYAGSLASALERVPSVVRLCAAELLDVRGWGFFWPAALLASIVLLARCRDRETALAASVVAGLALLPVPFLVTTWPVELQIAQAASRVAAQLAPAAAAVAVLGYARTRQSLLRGDLARVSAL